MSPIWLTGYWNVARGRAGTASTVNVWIIAAGYEIGEQLLLHHPVERGLLQPPLTASQLVHALCGALKSIARSMALTGSKAEAFCTHHAEP